MRAKLRLCGIRFHGGTTEGAADPSLGSRQHGITTSDTQAKTMPDTLSAACRPMTSRIASTAT